MLKPLLPPKRWPWLPIIDVFRYERHLRADEEILFAKPDDLLVKTVAVACDELVNAVSSPGVEIGSEILAGSPGTLALALAKLRPNRFPATLAVITCLHEETKLIGNELVYADYSQLCIARWDALKVCAQQHIALTHGDYATDASEWPPWLWKQYFQEFPQDQIRAPILYAIERLLIAAPTAFTDAVRLNFSHDFPELLAPPTF